jgi:hypothetical protein
MTDFELDTKRQLSKDNPLRQLLLKPQDVYLIKRSDLEKWAYLLESHWGWIVAHEKRISNLEKNIGVYLLPKDTDKKWKMGMKEPDKK